MSSTDSTHPPTHRNITVADPRAQRVTLESPLTTTKLGAYRKSCCCRVASQEKGHASVRFGLSGILSLLHQPSNQEIIIMPRDLFASPTASDPPLTSSPLPKTPQSGGGSTATGEDGYDETSGPNGQRSDWRAKANEKNNLHPYVQTLSKSSVDSCLALENSAFPENERCSKEKVGLQTVLFLSRPNVPPIPCHSFSSHVFRAYHTVTCLVTSYPNTYCHFYSQTLY